VARVLRPWLDITPSVRESVPYMMFSFDLDGEILARRRLDTVSVYLTGSALHEGRSYKLHGDGTAELDNTYRFLQPKSEIDVVLPLLQSSLWVDYREPKVLAQVLMAEFFACKRICIAKKRLRDGVYYSGIDQLLAFLKKFRYPAALTSFAGEWAAQFDHLSLDIGIDYGQHRDGTIHYPKTSFYGTL
jgi:hypothetical protein